MPYIQAQHTQVSLFVLAFSTHTEQLLSQVLTETQFEKQALAGTSGGCTHLDSIQHYHPCLLRARLAEPKPLAMWVSSWRRPGAAATSRRSCRTRPSSTVYCVFHLPEESSSFTLNLENTSPLLAPFQVTHCYVGL